MKIAPIGQNFPTCQSNDWEREKNKQTNKNQYMGTEISIQISLKSRTEIRLLEYIQGFFFLKRTDSWRHHLEQRVHSYFKIIMNVIRVTLFLEHSCQSYCKYWTKVHEVWAWASFTQVSYKGASEQIWFQGGHTLEGLCLLGIPRCHQDLKTLLQCSAMPWAFSGSIFRQGICIFGQAGRTSESTGGMSWRLPPDSTCTASCFGLIASPGCS